MYLFDTDTISRLLIKNPPSGLIQKVAAVPPDRQFTSAITVGELIYGACRSTRPDFFLDKLDRLVWPNIMILPFDEAAGHIYGQVRARLEQAGTPVSEPDLRIASIALIRKLILVTGNTRHFSRIPGLSIENWFR